MHHTLETVTASRAATGAEEKSCYGSQDAQAGSGVYLLIYLIAL